MPFLTIDTILFGLLMANKFFSQENTMKKDIHPKVYNATITSQMPRSRKENLFLFKFRIFFAETVNSSCCIQKTLLAGKKRMTGGAYFHMNLFALCRKNLFLVAAGAGNGGIVNLGMDIFFHCIFL